MSKYNFVKNCDIPEPPQSPIVVPNDSPINPLITLPMNPTIPLELIAKFLPCKYKGRFPCPEITVDNANDQQGGGGNSVTYNCLDKSELDVDFDIETYCCDVIEDQYGNEIDHDKIVLTSHSSLTLPYPDIIRKGWMHYLNTVAVTQFITNWNASHTNHIDACSRCWTPSILNQLYTYQTSVLANLDDDDFAWYFYSKTIVTNESPNLGYLLPLVDNDDSYVTDVELYEKGDPGLASLSLCNCTGSLLLRDEPIVQVLGTVRGGCNCSYPQITSPSDYIGNYDWALDPADDEQGYTPYSVDVDVPFWGYLSLQSGKVYATLPEQKREVITGVGTYRGSNNVNSITWNSNNNTLPTEVRTSSSNMNGEIPYGASVKIEYNKNKCSGDSTTTILSAEYQRVRPAVAQGAPDGNGNIQVRITGSGGATEVADATCYCPGAVSGTKGFVSYSDGSYHFFSRQASQEEEPVIREGQEGKYADLNGIGTITADQTLKAKEKTLPLYGTKFSTVLTHKDSGTATIQKISTTYYGTHANDGENNYWTTRSMNGLRFNHNAVNIASNGKICIANDIVVPNLAGTLKKISFSENGSTLLSDQPYTKYTYNGDDVYPISGGSYIYGSGSTYYHGDLDDTCNRTQVTATDVTTTGTAFSEHNYSLVDNTSNPTITLAYNPQVGGWETISGSLYIANTYYYRSTAPKGLYYRGTTPLDNYYTLESDNNGYYLKLKTETDARSFTIKQLLQMSTTEDKTNLFRFPSGTMELIRNTNRSTTDTERFDTLTLTTPGDLDTSLTFTLNTGNRSTFTETPLNIFNNGLSGGKKFAIHDGSVIVVDAGSYGEVPFENTKRLLYYWSPSVSLGSLSFTFVRCDKETGVTTDSTKVCKLQDKSYPMSYDSGLGAYRLDIGNTLSKCYKLSGNSTALTTAITFTFQTASNVDKTCTLKYAIQNRNKIRFKDSDSKVYTPVNPGVYWTCSQLSTSIAFETTRKERIDLTAQNSGGFTGFAWLV